jgi:uncharacterized protein YeaO (DUF488 family)
MPVHLKRAYEDAAESDGARYFVERLWPRGVKKQSLVLTEWLKDLAPSTELRKWYAHQPERQPEFAQRYKAELDGVVRRALLADLAREARSGNITLVFSTKEPELSGAVVLKDVLEGMASEA